MECRQCIELIKKYEKNEFYFESQLILQLQFIILLS